MQLFVTVALTPRFAVAVAAFVCTAPNPANAIAAPTPTTATVFESFTFISLRLCAALLHTSLIRLSMRTVAGQ